MNRHWMQKERKASHIKINESEETVPHISSYMDVWEAVC